MQNQNQELLDALKRLTFAASCRENVMGDPCSYLDARAKLRAELKHAREVIAEEESSQTPAQT